MQIVRDLAGYSLGRADLVRRAMGKKKLDVMAKEREIFINGQTDENGNVIIPGCVRNGIDEASANKIFYEMAEFASVLYCCSCISRQKHSLSSVDLPGLTGGCAVPRAEVALTFFKTRFCFFWLFSSFIFYCYF